jgi:protein-L-isoaspartate(D-aspartate) O-methyltransferase
MEWLMSAAGGSRKRQPHQIGGRDGAEPVGNSGSDSATSDELAAVARGKLADELRAAGRAEGAVEAAFRQVPRHAFLPEMEPVCAYQDRAVVIKSDSEGLPVSASTQPAMMAIMLGQLGLEPGHRVLEVGTGTGYNAALIARLVGSQESVVTIDVIPQLIEHARENLAAAGYGGVRVVCGDGAVGVPDYGPYDRIIVTTGAWDLPPEWWAQLCPGGRIVLPLSIRGIQVSVGLDNAGDHLVSRSACRCSFIRMAGAMTGPESLIALGPQPGLHAQAVDGPVPAADELYEALSGPAAEEPAGLRVSSIAEVADLDLWLTLTEPRLTRLNLMGRHETQASPAQQRIANLMPLGGLAQVGGPSGLGVAALTFGDDKTQHAGSFKITACGYGPGGPSLAKHLASQAGVWEALGRPGAAALELSAWLPGTSLDTIGGASMVLDRPHVRLAVRWPAS